MLKPKCPRPTHRLELKEQGVSIDFEGLWNCETSSVTMVLISKVLVEARDVLTLSANLWVLIGWGSILWKISSGTVTTPKCGHVCR